MDLRFLVVDDFDTMIRIIRGALSEMGHENVITARNGEQACQILGRERIDFIISDWNMPVMTGIDLLKAVRGNEKWAHIPFLMVTAEEEKEHILEAVKAKVDQYIIKPFTPAMLKEKIDGVLHSKLAATKKGGQRR